MPPRAARKTPRVEVLRLGHRPGRDPRLTTHLALTARALGAERLWLHPPDPSIVERLAQVRARWGGRFAVEPCEDWRGAIDRFDGPSVHLTMYGRPLPEVESELRAQPRLLAIVGGAKVPADLYQRSRWNVAIGNQPHSEVAALAILLEAVIGSVPPSAWSGARQRVLPRARGKRVRRIGA